MKHNSRPDRLRTDQSHQKTPQGEAKTEVNKLIVIFVAVSVTRFFTYWPESEILIYPFLFYEEGITIRTYVYLLTLEVSFLILVYHILKDVHKYYTESIIFITLQCVYVIDYMLSYNEANMFGLDIDHLRVIVMGGLLLRIMISEISEAVILRGKGFLLRVFKRLTK